MMMVDEASQIIEIGDDVMGEMETEKADDYQDVAGGEMEERSWNPIVFYFILFHLTCGSVKMGEFY